MTSKQRLAWALGLGGTAACVLGAAALLALDTPRTMLLVYLIGILLGLLGALIATREPGNSIGWLMCWASLAASLTHLPAGYAYFALIVQHGALPLGGTAAWLGAWGWAPVLALLPSIWVRFPDGKVRRGWRFVDLVSISGTALFILGIALLPTPKELDFLAIPSTKVAQLIPYVRSPLGIPVPAAVLAVVQGTGLTLMLTGFLGSAAALTVRYRRTGGDERLQLKWLAYSGVLIAVAFLYGAVAWNLVGQPLFMAFIPLEVASVTMPIALAVAILRYRLYDIDLIINRTVVYVTLTATVVAGYTAAVTFFERFFISVSGQSSNAAWVLSAFVVVVGFSPVKDWLQHRVDRRLGGVRASAALDQFRAGVDTVLSVIDVHRVACRFLDEAVVAFDARGAALYLGSAEPFYTCGHLNGNASIEVHMRHGGHELGRLVLADRRGHITYAERDRVALQKSADTVAEALALAARFRHRPLSRAKMGGHVE